VSYSDKINHVTKELFKASSDISFFLIGAPKLVSDTIFSDRDIENVFEIEGDFLAWVDAGYPTAPLRFNSGDKINE
jgi:hypothetical protein